MASGVSIVDGSILNEVKKYIGPSISYDVFDMDIIMNINAAFFTLFQLGVGDEKGVFTINDNTATWEDFCPSEDVIAATKQYIYLRVKNVFDPPTSSYVLQAYENQIRELEWRLRELGAGVFDDDSGFPNATADVLGVVMIGDFINIKPDGTIFVHDVMPIRKEYFTKMLNKVFGEYTDLEANDEYEDDEEEEEDDVDIPEINIPDDLDPGFLIDSEPNRPPHRHHRHSRDCLPIASEKELGCVRIGKNIDVDRHGRISIKRGDIVRIGDLKDMMDRVFGPMKRRHC